MIKSFNQANLKEIRESIRLQLSVTEEEFGVTIKQGNISFDDQSFKMPIEAYIGAGIDPIEAKALKGMMYAQKYDVSENDLKKIIVVRNKELIFLGIMHSSRKYPYVFRDNFGNYTKMTFTCVPLLKKSRRKEK